MNIAILTSFLYHQTSEIQGHDRVIFGGAERYLYELCKFLQSEGHKVVVYQCLNQTIVDKDGKNIRVQSDQISKNFYGIPVVCLPDTDNAWAYSTNGKLNMVFNEISSYFDLSIYFATFLCYPHVLPGSISISHGIFWDYPQHQIKNIKEDEVKEFFKRQLLGFKETDVCVAVDSNIPRVISAIDPGSERKIHVIYNFVDTEQFTPAEKDWEGMRVLFPRRLTQIRGCNEFIRASVKYPQYDYISVGQSGSLDLENSVIQWGNKMPNIRFISKPMEEMPKVYQQSDIAVVPTRACEGLSLSLLEAMSCGLPVITTPVGGLGDAVIDGYNALVCNLNHEDLGEYIDMMAKDEEMRSEFGKRNREIAKCFDITVWRAKWKMLIDGFGG